MPAENAEARWVIPPNQGYIVNIHISFLHSFSFAGRASNTCKTFFAKNHFLKTNISPILTIYLQTLPSTLPFARLPHAF